MFKHILIPTDGTALADKAVAAGIDFAREAGARVTLFTAVPEYQMPTEGELMTQRATSLDAYARLAQQKAGAILAGGASLARAAGVACDTDYALDDRPHHAIVAAALHRRQGRRPGTAREP